MKILNLSFSNLNSLKGNWHIDFDDPAFADGIFAISGQTGAGKTTILDAICLAIYGQTPRLNIISNTQNELMSMGTGECFASVEIQIAQKLYRFYWGQHRAGKKPSGKLQAIRREISQLQYPKQVGATIIESKANLCEHKAIVIMQMNFRQFTRSVMLTQGDFSAFLKANANEKGEILEQMTGTGIYGEISKKAYQIAKQKSEELTALQNQLNHHNVISDEAFLQLKNSLDDKQNVLNHHKQHYQTLEKNIKLLTQKQQKNQHIAQLKNSIAQSQYALELFAPNIAILDKANRAFELESHYQALIVLDQQIQTSKQELDNLQQQLPILLNKHKKDSLIQEKYIAQLNHLKESQKNSLELFKAVRQLDQQIQKYKHEEQISLQRQNELSIKLTSIHHQLRQLAQEKDNANMDIEHIDHLLSDLQHFATIDNKITKIQLLQTQLINYLNKANEVQFIICQHKDELIRQQNNIYQKRQQYKNLKNRIDQENQQHRQLLKQAKRVLNLSEDCDDFNQDDFDDTVFFAQEIIIKDKIYQNNLILNTAQILLEQFKELKKLQKDNKKNNEHKQQAQQQKEQLEHLISYHKNLQEKEKHTLLALEQSYNLIKEIYLLKKQLDTLQDGTPCPVCGSLNHPYKNNHQSMPNIKDSEQKIHQSQQHIDDYQQKIQDDTIKLHQIQTNIAHLEQKNQEIQQKITQLKEKIASHIESLKHSRQSIATKHNNLINDNIVDIQKFLTVVRKNLEQLNQHANYHQDQQIIIKNSSENIAQLTQQLSNTKNEGILLNNDLQICEHKLAQQKTEQSSLVEQIDLTAQTMNEFFIFYGQPSLNIDHDNYNKNTINHLNHKLTNSLNYISQQHQDYQNHLTKKDILTQKISAIDIHIQNTKNQCQDYGQTNQENESTLLYIRQNLQTLIKKRQEIFGNKDVDIEENNIQQTIANTQKDYENFLLTFEQDKKQLTTINHQIEIINKHLLSHTNHFNQQTASFKQLLLQKDFASQQEFLTARMDSTQREALAQEYQHLLGQLNNKKQDLEFYEAELLALLDKNPHINQLNLTQIEQEKNNQQTMIDELIETIGQEKQIYIHAKKERQQYQELYERITNHKNNNEIWFKLDKLIGSADGKKYRNFVQGLTLDMVLFYANQVLHQMSKRYILKHNHHSKDLLQIDVIDTHQANEIRSSKNLSGGESFIVSLALAMGLSMMNSNKVDICSLFLDEGFGTLDDEILDIALSTLSTLNKQGKMIGIISHVPALKECIHSKIIVKKQNNGSSILTGAGIHRQ